MVYFRTTALLLSALSARAFAPSSVARATPRTVAFYDESQVVKGPYWVDDPWVRESEDEEDFSDLVPNERGLLTYPIPEGYFRTENIPGKTEPDEELQRLKAKDLDELKRRVRDARYRANHAACVCARQC